MHRSFSFSSASSSPDWLWGVHAELHPPSISISISSDNMPFTFHHRHHLDEENPPQPQHHHEEEEEEDGEEQQEVEEDEDEVEEEDEDEDEDDAYDPSVEYRMDDAEIDPTHFLSDDYARPSQIRPHHHFYHSHPQPQSHHHQQQEQQHHRLGRVSPNSMVCLSCKETFTPRGAGTCIECYEEASETEEVLKKEIEELNARIVFLNSWAPEAMADDCTDFVLESSDGSKITAHRAVLISRSSVFKAMLENEMEESRSRTIKITDFTCEVLRLFVHYLYTAEIYPESLDESAFDLLALAEKYNVKHLKSVCERFLASKVNNENALFNYEYASRHEAKTLKQVALSSILESIHELPAKDEYKHLVDRDAKLIVEIFEVYLGKQNKSSS